MDGVKLARIRTCQSCRFWRNAPASVWHWPKCWHASLGVPPDLDNARLEGPDVNCPAGYWIGLPPIDLEAERQAAHAGRVEQERKSLGPVLAALLDGLAEEEKGKRLMLAVEAHMVTPEIAAEVTAGSIKATPATPSDSSSPCVSSLPCVAGSAEQGAGFAEQGAGFAGREGGEAAK
jgi:hypothetical protein